MTTTPSTPTADAQRDLVQRRKALGINANPSAAKRVAELADFRRFTRDAMRALAECGAFERNEAAAREAEARAEAEARRREIEALRGRGIALKHARVLVGELPLRAPEVDDEGAIVRYFPLAVARRWAASESTLLILCGPKGCGKSFAGAEQVRRFGGISVPARLLLRHAWWANKVGRQGERLKSPITGLHQYDLLHAPIVMIDDVGQEDDEDRIGTRDVVDHLICLRCDAGLRTIVTTNARKASPDELRATGDARSKAMEGTWEAYLGVRLQTVAGRVCEYGAVIQCPPMDLRAEERLLAAAAAKAASKEAS